MTSKPPIVVSDILDVPDDFLAEQVEDASFFRNTRAAMKGFDQYFAQIKVDGLVTAIAPYFVTRFSLGTMLSEGPLRRVLGPLGLKIACVGHPATAIGRVHGALDPASIDALARHLFKRAPIACFKGFGESLPAPRFVRLRGLPCAVLHHDRAAWLELRKSRNFRRKLKACHEVRYEEHLGLPPQWMDRVYDLYCGTHERAATQFGKLERSYFENTSAASLYTLLFLGDELVAFAQILRKGSSSVASFMGMDYRLSEAYGLYFAIVMRILDIAADWNLETIEMGETSYAFKRKIGCELVPTWIYYRHRWPLMNVFLRGLAPLLEPSAEELM